MSDNEDVSLSGGGADKRPHASSYYAWSADKARRGAELSALGVSHVPQPIHAAPGAPAPATSSGAGAGSAWNAAGTWEERDISTRATAALEAVLQACAFKVSGPAAGSEYTLSVTSVPTCSGTVTIVFSRGKAKPGYEMSVTASWQLSDAASSRVAAGSVTFVDLCDSEGSDMFARLAVECTDASGPLDKSSARMTALRSAELFRQALREWMESLKSM